MVEREDKRSLLGSSHAWATVAGRADPINHFWISTHCSTATGDPRGRRVASPTRPSGLADANWVAEKVNPPPPPVKDLSGHKPRLPKSTANPSSATRAPPHRMADQARSLARAAVPTATMAAIMLWLVETDHLTVLPSRLELAVLLSSRHGAHQENSNRKSN